MTPVGTRRAALLLHALAVADRDWLLESLPARRRAEMQVLLDELQALGIEPDPGLVPQWLQPQPHPLQDLRRGELRRLARWLALQPPVLVARLLAGPADAWRQALLSALPPGFAAQVRAVLRSPRAPALEAAVLQAVQARVEQWGKDRRTPWTRLLQWGRARQSGLVR